MLISMVHTSSRTMPYLSFACWNLVEDTVAQ